MQEAWQFETLHLKGERGTCRWVQSIPQTLRAVSKISHLPWGPAMQVQPYTYHHVLLALQLAEFPTSTSSSAPAAVCALWTCASSPPAVPAQFMQGRARLTNSPSALPHLSAGVSHQVGLCAQHPKPRHTCSLPHQALLSGWRVNNAAGVALCPNTSSLGEAAEAAAARP